MFFGMCFHKTWRICMTCPPEISPTFMLD
jgi:hypothetical protein